METTQQPRVFFTPPDSFLRSVADESAHALGTEIAGIDRYTPCPILICIFVNERFLGTHIELRCETFCVIDIGLESLRHGENGCRGQQ